MGLFFGRRSSCRVTHLGSFPLEVCVIPKLQGEEGYYKILHLVPFHLCFHVDCRFRKQHSTILDCDFLAFPPICIVIAAWRSSADGSIFPLQCFSFPKRSARNQHSNSHLYKRILCVDCESAPLASLLSASVAGRGEALKNLVAGAVKNYLFHNHFTCY